MLTQQEADYLIELLKKLINEQISFPTPSAKLSFELRAMDNKESFLLDINRTGRIKSNKCTYQCRYKKEHTLLRLDVNASPHTNPDGTIVSGNHLHIYREGFGDKFAIEFSGLPIESTIDLINTLRSFLTQCNVDISKLHIQGGMFDDT